MQNSIQVKIAVSDADVSDMLVAQLSDLGYDGFEEGEAFLLAYCPQPDFSEEELKAVLAGYRLDYETVVIEAQNWNAVWESNFQPVKVDDFVGIRAEFHEPFSGVEHEIVITPKMSFGTGHHATTRMMMQQMRQVDFKGKQVFDFGTGTGILAILAEKLGAATVIAIDYDEWCITNATENTERNGCVNTHLQQADTPAAVDAGFSVILANINKNILLEYIPQLAEKLESEGCLLLSGLLVEDEEDILAVCSRVGLQHISTIGLDKWICIRLLQKIK